MAQKEDLIGFLTDCVDNPVGIFVVWDYLQLVQQILSLSLNIKSNINLLINIVSTLQYRLRKN